MNKRLKRLKDGASGRLKDLAGKARQLEGVLNDLKSRDFMQSPKIQELMAKVTVQGLKAVPYITRSRVKAAKGAAKKRRVSETAFRGKLKALELQIGPQVAKHLIQTIMKRADEIKKSYWDVAVDTRGSSKKKSKSSKKAAVKKAKRQR